MLDDRLSLSVTHADGRITRWGPDCPDGKDIPGDLTLSDSIPGGYGTLTTSLLRRIDVQHTDEALFDAVRCYGPGGRTAWDGYMAQFPRTHGDGFGVSPGAVGWSAVLRWDTGFREVYVDTGTASWVEAPLERRAALTTTSIPLGKIPASTTGGLSWQIPNEALPAFEETELYYFAPAGVTLRFLHYKGKRTGTFTSIEAATLFSGNSYSFASTSLTLDDTFRLVDLVSAVKSQFMLRAATTGAVTPPVGTAQYFSRVAVYGSHSLTMREVSNDHYGLYASDVLADIISRAAPVLSTDIEATAFPIPHLVYSDPVTAEFAISDVNKYHLYDWGVYDNREFFFRAPDPNRLLWEARLSDGAQLDADGDTAEQVINGVFVIYQDPTGVQRTVGPPTGSFDATDTALEDTSSTNPVNAHGLGRKWVPLTLSFPTTQSGATAIGAAYLAERSLAGRRGSVTLTGTATHPTEGKVPCWRVRSGDWITLKDLNGSIVPRKIISKSYTHSNRQVRLDLDNTVAKLDAILARVGIQTGIATGGGF